MLRPTGFRPSIISVLIGLITCTLWSSDALFVAHADDRLCFSVPGIADCLDGRFRSYWQDNGGLPVFGYPITAVQAEQNRDTGQMYQTQWLERNRFELHPENRAPYDVLLGRLGAELLAQQGRGFENVPAGTSRPGRCRDFTVGSGRQIVCDPFLAYWESHGLEFDGQPGTSYAESLALFGFPLTSPRYETNPNGDTVLTQWFERARFEEHPSNPPAYRVLLGLLGRELRATGPQPPPVRSTPTSQPTTPPRATATVGPTSAPTSRVPTATPVPTIAPTATTPPLSLEDHLVLHEYETVYRSNLERRARGLVPLKINRQLTDAARWFARDSTENRPAGFCGHQASDGSWPDVRARRFGYLGFAGAENAYCGYVSPQAAVEGWMNSPGHRANLLDPNHREIGLGTYRRASDGRGYLAQMFGVDPAYPPVIINNEAISTMEATVEVFVASTQSKGTWRGGLGPITEMRLANSPTWTGVGWQPYQDVTRWTLGGGTGWRTVYVQLRDALGRMTQASDTIYLGPNPPVPGPEQASTTASQVNLSLQPNGASQMQLSNNWLVDDSDETFGLNWGDGSRVADAQAMGGTAFELRQSGSQAWVWTVGDGFVQNMPMMALVRVSGSGAADADLVEVVIETGTGTFGPIRLRGSDVVGGYHEVALPFTFVPSQSDEFLKLVFRQIGDGTVRIDGARFFTAPQPAASQFQWPVPGGNYRGGAIQVRYLDGAGRLVGSQEVVP